MSEKNLYLYQIRALTCIKEEPGLISEKNLDLCQRITWTGIRGRGLVSEKNLYLYQIRELTCIKEEPVLVSDKDVDLYQRRTWIYIREET